MKFIKIFLTSLCLIITTVANADVASQTLNKVSEKISEYTIGLIPGEGTTEFDIQLSDKDNNEPRINLLLLLTRCLVPNPIFIVISSLIFPLLLLLNLS